MRDFFTRHRPSPGTVIAVVALIAAVAGTAIAGPLTSGGDFKLTGKEKRQVRKIVRKEITVAAPNLSVKSAKTADRADTAGTADTATSATTAQTANTANNAEQVDGHNATCPADTFEQDGVCFDTNVRFPMTPWNGVDTCVAAGGRLPTITELLSIRNVTGVDLGPPGTGHWADVTYDDDGTEEAAVVVDNGDVQFEPVGNQNQLRCAFNLVR